MQNVKNAAEIQQRVINLVELYRTKVSKESQMAKDLAIEFKNQYDAEIDFAYSLHEQGIEGYCLDIRIPEDAVDEIRANEQLLGYFYKKVAKESADKEVTGYFLAEKFDSSIFTCEEESFLVSHFREMVNYIIQTPNNNLSAVEGDDRNDLYLLPTEVLDIIKERVAMPTGAKIYNPFTGFAQLTCIYKDCSFLCEESYMPYFVRWNAYCKQLRETEHIVEQEVNDYKKLNAWMKVTLYANGVDASVIINGSVPQQYDAVMSYIPYIPSEIPTNSQLRTVYDLSEPDMINKIMMSYQNLAEGGKMVLILPTEYLWKKVTLFSEGKTSYVLELGNLWKQMVNDKSFVEIIQLPPVMGKNLYGEGHSIIFAEKGRNVERITFTDARSASIKSEGDLFKQVLDIKALHAMIENGGIDPITGLRKYVQVWPGQVNSNLLVPQFYVIEKPAEDESPVPLTDLCSIVTSHVYDVPETLPEDTPWVKSDDLSDSFRGVLDIGTLDTAACSNNPTDWSYGNRTLNNLFMGKNRYSERDIRISHYRNCKYIDGKSDAILFKLSRDSISLAVIKATGSGIAISPSIHVLLPNEKMDVLSLTALLRTPVVYRQIETYEKFGLYGSYGHAKDVLIPTDMRILYDRKQSLHKEQMVCEKYEVQIAKMHKDQMDRLCNYQHGMRKHIREISSAVRRMERYINEMESSEEVKAYLMQRLGHIKDQRQYLSEDIERLNEENIFGDAVPNDIDHILKGYTDYFGSDVCSIKFTNEIAKEALHEYIDKNRSQLSSLDEISQKNAIDCVKTEKSITYVDIAEYNFGKIVRNILENAKKHGFDDFNGIEHKDRIIEIVLDWDKERQMYRIDFRNNGNPLPEGLTKEGYGENRKYAGKTGGSGIGGYEIAENVKHYNGDYMISQDRDCVVVSIYFPKSNKDGEGV